MCALQTSQSKYPSQIKHFPAPLFSATFFPSGKLEVIKVLIMADVIVPHVMSPLIIHFSRDYLQPPDIITGCLQQPPNFSRYHSPQEIQRASSIIFYWFKKEFVNDKRELKNGWNKLSIHYLLSCFHQICKQHDMAACGVTWVRPWGLVMMTWQLWPEMAI